MSLYELLTLLHVVAVIVWLGAGFLIALLVLGAERSGDHAKEAGYHQDVGWLAPRLFVPASLTTLASGLLLVLEGSWSLGQLWVVVGLVGWAASFLLGFFYFRPEGPRIGALAAERGPTDPEVGRRLHRLNVVDRLQLAILFIVVAAMVLKPAGNEGGILIAGVLLLAVATGVAAMSVRRRADLG